MRVIVIERTVYKVTEKQFEEIRKIESDIHKNGYHLDNDIKVSDYLESNKHLYEEIGIVDYDFRL